MNQFWRARSIFNALLIVCLLSFISAHATQAKLNLPQLRQSIHLSGETSATLNDYFLHTPTARELPPSLHNALLQGLPKTFIGSCGDLMEAWGGGDARISAVWQVRLLHSASGRVWLAFRCSSSESRLADYNDERLALLRVSTGVLEMLPLDPDTKNSDEVHQIDFVQRIPLPGVEGFSFRVKVPQNPCCDGPESRWQERFMVFVDSPAGVVESLSTVTMQDDLSHCDDPEVDTETTYNAEIKFVRDSRHFVIALSAPFHEKVTDTTYESGMAKPHTTSEHSGTLEFRWDGATLKFMQVH